MSRAEGWFYSVDTKLVGRDAVIEDGFRVPEEAYPYAALPEIVAQECGEDYHDEHDGWESSWPIKVYLYDGDGEPKGVFEVFMESQPHFYASEADDDDE